VVTGLASNSFAANYTWDSSGTTPGAPVDGAGTWGTGNANWATGVAPVSDVSWTNGANVAIFGSNNGTAGPVTLSSALTVSGITFKASISGNYTLTGGSLAAPNGTTLTITSNVDATIDSPFVGAASTWNTLDIVGPGILTLSGASTFSQPFLNINAGATVRVSVLHNSNVAGPLGQSSGGVRFQGGTLIYNGGTTNSTNQGLKFYQPGGTFDMEGTGVMNIGNNQNGNGTMSANRTITLTGNATPNYTGASKKGFGLLQGAIAEYVTITNGAKTSLLKTGSGDWYLGSATASTYTGGTTIAAGRLGFMANNALPAGTTVTLGADSLSNTAILDMGPATNTGLAAGVTSYSVTVAGLTSKGTDLTKDIITNSDTSAAASNHVATLTVNPDGAATAADSAFGGLITNGTTSKVALVKAGSHALTLSGSNTYSGGTTVSGGILKTASTGGTFGAGNVTVITTGTTLEIDNNTSIADTATLSLASGTVLNMQFASTTDPSTFESVGILNLGGTIFATPITFSNGNYHGFDAYFTGSTSTATLQVVPEPGSLGLCGAAGAILLERRRHMRRRLNA